MEEKRHHARVPLNVDVTLEVAQGNSSPGFAKDISLGGMFVQSDLRPKYNEKVTITLQLPGSSEPTRLLATVRWTNDTGFGVQFGLLGARETHRITEILKKGS